MIHLKSSFRGTSSKLLLSATPFNPTSLKRLPLCLSPTKLSNSTPFHTTNNPFRSTFSYRCYSTETTLRRLLTPEQNEVLQQELVVLEELKTDFIKIDASKEDLALLRKTVGQLEELFLLVVVGEFNSGKTSFLNALLGNKFLKEGVTPTTSRINILKYGVQTNNVISNDGVSETVYLPVDWLKEISLVDTPGTNAIIRAHQQITEHFVPRSDLILFVTSVERPFSESERVFLELIKDWGKKVVVVVSKVDVLESPEDLQEVKNFVNSNFKDLFGVTPMIFPVSSKKALKAKLTQSADSQLWKESEFENLERYIQQTLKSNELARLKLLNPIGVADVLLHKYRGVIDTKLSVLGNDSTTLKEIDDQLKAYKEETLKDFLNFSVRIENCLLKMADRSEKFFEDRLHITNFFNLLKTDLMRNEFQAEVVADTAKDIEAYLGDIIDWTIERQFRQWRAVVDYINKRPIVKSEKIVGGTEEFSTNRSNLIESIKTGPSKLLESVDKANEATKLAGEMRQALVQTAAIEVGAFGLGAVLAASVLDITGILGASVVAIAGLGILPYRKRVLKREMRAKLNDITKRLHTTLETHFTRELDNGIQRIKDTITPYTLFIRSEHSKLESLKAKLKEDSQRLKDVQSQITKMFPSSEEKI